jgi:hypothetical protein
LRNIIKLNRILHAQSVKDEKAIPKVDLDKRVPNFVSEIWTLFFDGSKSQEGDGAGCIFIDPVGKHNFFLVD